MPEIKDAEIPFKNMSQIQTNLMNSGARRLNT